MKMDHLISARRPYLVFIYKKKKKRKERELVIKWILQSQRTTEGKIKENGKIKKYLDLDRELKRLWNTNVTVIAILVGVLETVPKDMEERLEDLEIRKKIETIKTTPFLRLT